MKTVTDRPEGVADVVVKLSDVPPNPITMKSSPFMINTVR